MSNIFNPTNPEKLKRAEIITALVLGSRDIKNDEEETLKSRHTEILTEKGIDLKDEQAVLESVYATIGGGVVNNSPAEAEDGATAGIVPKGQKAQKPPKAAKVTKPKTK